MIKKLSWRAPTSGTVPRGINPNDPTLMPTVQGSQGWLSDHHPEPKFTDDPNWTDIEIGRDFSVDAHSALLWMTGQDVPLPKTVSQSKDAVMLRFPGDFTPALNRAGLSRPLRTTGY